MDKKQFYIKNLTWGILINIVGFVVAIALLVTGHKPKYFSGCIHFIVGEYWGGLNLGLVILTDKNPTEETLLHEFGHAVQNAHYGLLFPFIVAIPSAIRYWIREFQYRSGNPPKTDYYSIWFEKQATEWGIKYKFD